MGMDFPEGGWAWDSVETILRRRGHVIASTGEEDKTLWPPVIQQVDAANAYLAQHGGLRHREVFGDSALKRYVDFFGRGGFRKMMRILLSAPSHAAPSTELAGMAGKRFGEYMEFLEALLMVEQIEDNVRLLRPVPDLGPSLEHYVAQLFMYELRAHALWGVNLEGVENGDFDVVAWLPPTLVYVECKSGAPAGIDTTDLRQTLRRTTDLAPDLTVVLVDTETDLGPVASKLNSASIELVNTNASSFCLPASLQTDFGGIHSGIHEHWPVYVAGAKPSMLSQLRWCLRHYHSQGKWR